MDAGKERILIVDDMETNRLILEDIIINMGYSPTLAESGEEALEEAIISKTVLTDVSIFPTALQKRCMKILKQDVRYWSMICRKLRLQRRKKKPGRRPRSLRPPVTKVIVNSIRPKL